MSTVGIFALIIFLAFALFQKVRNRRQNKLPPGPPADPILGHLRIFPRLNQSEKFYEWSKQYGKLSFLSVVQSRAEGAFDRGCHSP